MVGKYDLEIYNNRVHYHLEIKRNITIIQGDSATGKSTLIRMIAEYERLGNGSGNTLICERPCVVLPFGDWEHYIQNAHGQIIFVEENMPMIRTKEFAEAVNAADSYFVIIYRDSLPQLAYSIEEIYGIHSDRESQKYVKTRRVYNSLYQIYNVHDIVSAKPDVIVTEDSNAGHDFYAAAFPGICVSANGKTKVHVGVKEHAGENTTVLAVVDGAAFGADMQRFMTEAANCPGRCLLYAPESFEYLLLCSGIIAVNQEITERTYDFADSSIYPSWERYFTAVLSDLSQNTIYQYSKTKLNRNWLTGGNLRKVLDLLPEMIVAEEEEQQET